MTDPIELQREVTRAALEALDGHRFALAGSGAIREHGFIQRLSHDVDLFAPGLEPAAFGAAIDTVTTALRTTGYRVGVVRQTETFAAPARNGRWRSCRHRPRRRLESTGPRDARRGAGSQR